MSINEEQFEGKIADAMRSLGPDAVATACFVLTKDGNGKVGFRVMGESPELQQGFILGIMSSCLEMLIDIQTTGEVDTPWYKESDENEP